MTHSGFSPRATRSMLSNELPNAFFQFSHLGPAICGVRMMFGRVSGLCSGAGGFSTMT